MLQRIFLLLLMIASTQSLTYSQDTQPPVSKKLDFYICGGSGNINPNVGKILNHWGESGLAFSQNFEKARWLKVSALAAVCTGNDGMTKDANNNWHATSGNSMSGQVVAGYLKTSLSFDKYFVFSLHSQGRIDLDLKYGISLPANQTIKFRTLFEILPTGKSFYLLPQTDERPAGSHSVLHHMDYRIIYTVQFHKNWGYELETRFRFNGGRDDSLEAIKNSFNIRLNNTFYYSNPNGFGGYLQFRYQPTHIMTGNTKHNLYLNAGVNFSYDLSTL